MRTLAPLFAFACLTLIPFVASAQSRLLDPVVTHTNGMPLASSTPYRSHIAAYQCDPNRVGCCGGRYNLPCLNSLLDPNNCCTGSRRPGVAYDAMGAELIAVSQTDFEILGEVPARGIGAVGAGAAGGAVPPRPVPNRPNLLQQILPR